VTRPWRGGYEDPADGVLSADQPRLRVVPDLPDDDENGEFVLDYGEGKTLEQEAADSVAMLGAVLVIVLATIAGVVIAAFLLLWVM
jgi:hypothetical protein